MRFLVLLLALGWLMPGHAEAAFKKRRKQPKAAWGTPKKPKKNKLPRNRRPVVRGKNTA